MGKKSFKDTPTAAAMFISEPAVPETVPQGFKINHALVETKSKRVQLLMQPSLHSRVKAAADAQGISFNDYVHRALERALEGE